MRLVPLVLLALMLTSPTTTEKEPLESKGEMLSAPHYWSYQKLDIPLSYVPDADYTGYEELVLSPGMYDKNSDEYFTYAFIMSLDNRPKLGAGEIDHFFSQYFRGMAKAAARKNGVSLNENQVTVRVRELGPETYSATVQYQDGFNSGDPVSLNMSIILVYPSKCSKTYLYGAVSPRMTTDPLWSQLDEIRNAIDLTDCP